MRARALALAALGAAAIAGCGDPATVEERAGGTPESPSSGAENGATGDFTPTPAGVSPVAVGSGAIREDLGIDAEVNARVAGLDLDGDGRDEIAVASARGLVVLGRDGSGGFRVVAEAPSRGGATAVTAGDLDGDGHPEIAVGWGVHREHLEAPALLSVYRAGGASGGLQEEVVARPATPRAQFSTLLPGHLDGRAGLLFAHFTSKYDVRGAFAWHEDSRDGDDWRDGVDGDHEKAGPGGATWHQRELGVLRMAAHWLVASLPDGRDAVFIGRPYGDALKSDGDVFLLGSDGTRTPLPSLRGVRSLAFVEFGGPTNSQWGVCYGDGWHWRYRERGEGLLTCARPGDDGGWISQQVADTGGYEINTIASGDLDGDGVVELIALGSDALHAYTPTRGDAGESAFSHRTLGPGGFHMAVVDTDGDGRSEVVLAGERPQLFRLP